VRIRFSPGTTLVAFTDGLFEKRGQSLDQGLAELAAAAAQSPPRPDELVSHLVTALTTSDQEDDIAVLAIKCSARDTDRQSPDASQPEAPSLSHSSS
jgi:serine phosphatase RsbU (regulator of sigma subunit)